MADNLVGNHRSVALRLCHVQVVLGVLGCPNLPQGRVNEEVGSPGVAHSADDDDVGCLFLAHRCDGGAYPAGWLVA